MNEFKIVVDYGVNGIITGYPKQMKDKLATI